LVLLLALALAGENPLMKALSIPNGSPVAVRTSDGGKLRGVLESLSGNEMTLRMLEGNRFVSKAIPLAQIAGLKKKGKVPRPSMGGGGGGMGMPGAGLDGALGGIPEGAPVTATLADKSTVNGRFAGRSAEGVGIQVPGEMTPRKIPMDQLAGIRQPKNGKLPGMPKLQSPSMVKKSLSGIPIGSPVNLTMPGGAALSGKMMGMDAKGFSLQTLEGSNLVTKQLTFDQVAGVKMPRRPGIPGFRKPGLQTPEALKAKALNIPTGSPVTVNMPGGQQFTGKFLGASNEGMQIQGMQGSELVTQTLPYDAVGSLKTGAPVTLGSRARGLAKQSVSIIVTAGAAGLLSGILSR
jgi:hypothetical protein